MKRVSKQKTTRRYTHVHLCHKKGPLSWCKMVIEDRYHGSEFPQTSPLLGRHTAFLPGPGSVSC